MSGTKENKKTARRKDASLTATRMTRQKVLIPTLKSQQRYLVYSVVTKQASMTDFALVHNNIIRQCNFSLGVFDAGKAALMGVKYLPEKSRGIIRVDSKYVDKLKVCLGMIESINNVNLIVDCIFVSGVLNKALDKMNS